MLTRLDALVYGTLIFCLSVLGIGWCVDTYHTYYRDLEISKQDFEWAQTKVKWKRDREEAAASRKAFELQMMNREYDREMGR